MAKKKSKSQKKKQNYKRKLKQQQVKKVSQVVPSNEVKYNVAITEPERFKKKEDKKVVKPQEDSKKQVKKQEYIKSSEKSKKEIPLPKEKKGKVVKNTDVIYNVALKREIAKKDESKKKFNLKEFVSSIKNKIQFKKKDNKKIVVKKDVQQPKKNKKVSKDYVIKKEVTKKGKEINNSYTIKAKKPKNIFLRILYEIWRNLNVFFDAILILTFALFVIGLVKVDLFDKSTIYYICGLILFLMIVAISYNKHIEGWIFTLLLCGGMGFAIYRLNYTYDFINALNTEMYEPKTYYVVTFDNSTNINLYNVSNKKVGLLKDNSTNIERYLNTKIKTNYIEYDDVNVLFDDFYEQQLRAVIVRDNEYKYLENNTQNNKSVKILYEFQVNGKK